MERGLLIRDQQKPPNRGIRRKHDIPPNPKTRKSPPRRKRGLLYNPNMMMCTIY